LQLLKKATRVQFVGRKVCGAKRRTKGAVKHEESGCLRKVKRSCSPAKNGGKSGKKLKSYITTGPKARIDAPKGKFEKKREKDAPEEWNACLRMDQELGLPRLRP